MVSCVVVMVMMMVVVMVVMMMVVVIIERMCRESMGRRRLRSGKVGYCG
jgi:hypothetical protein